MPKKKTKPSEEVTNVQLAQIADEYVTLKENIKQADISLKDKRTILEKALDEKGSLIRGSQTLLLNKEASEKSFAITWSFRKSAVATEDAIPYLKSKGFSEAIKTVETIDESIVNALVESGKLTTDDVNKLFSLKETKVFGVKEVK